TYPSGHAGVTAKDGSSWLATNVGTAPCSSSEHPSFYQDVPIPSSPGDSYTLSAWVRASSGTFNGRLVLWGLGGGNQPSVKSFTAAASQWTLVTVPLDVHQTGHTSLRAQIYEDDCNAGHDLYVDGAQLLDAGLASASFEGTEAGWATLPATGVNHTTYPSGHAGVTAKDGSSWLSTNVGTAPCSSSEHPSFYQDV